MSLRVFSQTSPKQPLNGPYFYDYLNVNYVIDLYEMPVWYVLCDVWSLKGFK